MILGKVIILACFSFYKRWWSNRVTQYIYADSTEVLLPKWCILIPAFRANFFISAHAQLEPLYYCYAYHNHQQCSCLSEYLRHQQQQLKPDTIVPAII